MGESQDKILVIKLSALGDFVQNMGIFKAIRTHHQGTHITLLTEKPYTDLARQSGYFDDVWIDKRPKFYQLGEWIKLKNQLNGDNFSWVYDLQINDRTALYYSLLKKKPNWVGQLNKNKRQKTGFAFDRHKELLNSVGIKNVNIDDLSWMESDIQKFNLPPSYALIVPGSAPTRPEKRWPAHHYIDLCEALLSRKITPVIIGTNDEKDVTTQIAQNNNQVIDLTGKTSLIDLAPLARKATMAIGNDTGPMHFIGPTGCKAITLFSRYSDPLSHAPLGDNVITIQKDDIADISVDNVIQKIEQ